MSESTRSQSEPRPRQAEQSEEAAIGDLLDEYFARLVQSIRRKYPPLAHEAEDVAGEAIWRFYKWDGYDGRATPENVLYVIARRVALDWLACKSNWRKSMRLEAGGMSAVEVLEAPEPLLATLTTEAPDAPREAPDDVGPWQSPLQQAVQECLERLSKLQQEILWAHARRVGTGYELHAVDLGRELGPQYRKDGQPIPDSTVRVNHLRAKDAMKKCLKNKGFDLEAWGYTDE